MVDRASTAQVSSLSPDVSPAAAGAAAATAVTEQMIWSPSTSKILLEYLLKVKRAGKRSVGGWMTSDYTGAARQVALLGNPRCDASACQSHWKVLKLTWKEWLQHCNNSEWRFDVKKGVPVAKSEVMDEYFKKHPERKPFRDRQPMYAELLEELVGKSAISGKFASVNEEAVTSLVAQEEPIEISESDILESMEEDSESDINQESSSSDQRTVCPQVWRYHDQHDAILPN